MIEARNLVRRFGPVTAVAGVSFAARPGEVLGFLGPNGAGKTTTTRMLTGFLEPSSGDALIEGVSVVERSREARRLIGYLPESSPVYRDCRVWDFLRFIAGIRGLRGDTARAAIDRAVARCSLETVLTRPIETLSKGYIRRACFAQAILHDPPALVLDEPTDGLDPNQKSQARKLIREMGRTKAIILSTHILEEVEACCDRVAVLAEGRIVMEGTPADLRALSPAAGTVSGRLTGPDRETAAAAFAALPGLDGATTIEDAGAGKVAFQARPATRPETAATAAAIASMAATRGWTLEELKVEPGRLDEAFRLVTGAAEKKEAVQ